MEKSVKYIDDEVFFQETPLTNYLSKLKLLLCERKILNKWQKITDIYY